ncbi:hypothetical protein ABIE51_002710 [Lysobacter sp. OAE881]|uniref:hypothetical protein n=1 Tax=Lysobacter sp. OAE881 TaxID=2663813 RepID=UPI0017895BAB
MRRPLLNLYVASATWAAARPGDTHDPIGGEYDPNASGGAEWTRIAQALSAHSGAIGPVRIVLSARLCRFLVAPWVADCFTGPSIRASVLAMFESQGVTDASHRVEIDWPAYGQPVPAVAYPRSLVDMVRTALEASGGTIVSTVASVVPVLRRHGRALEALPGALLAYAEDDGITGITLESGSLVQVEALASCGAGLGDVGLWLSRKRFAFADDGALHWLGSSPAPEAFAGRLLALEGDALATPGRALVAACA